MRVLCTVSGWPAHWFPMVPVGWALRAAGHEVRVACPPDQAAAVAAAGLVPVPVLGALDMTFLLRYANLWAARAGTWPYPWAPLHPLTGEAVDLASFDLDAFADTAKRRIATETEAGFAAALGYARRFRPDLVLHDRLSADGLLAARVLGVPAVAHLWGPVGTDESDGELYPLPVDHTRAFPRHGVGDLNADALRHVVDPCPPGLRPPIRGTRLDVRYQPYNGPGRPAELPPPGDRPRVCVVWSNSMSRMYGAGAYLVPSVVRALAELDVEVVLPAHPDDVARLGELPERVRVLPATPLHLLLPGCAAVVHHGGAGCAMTALAAGVPQLALTFGAEQRAIGRRVTATGAGLDVAGHLADAARIRDAVRELLDDPRYPAAAAELADRNAARPTVAALATTLRELAAVPVA
ncbi:nucleotide disphospho-sugar-binding domain-containing protein [Micromonospora sp. NPDC050980]|uniref:nucleotide disphospho-sugar-binding domain-containing protein n=1 Tax=Micromonospora sp. NPDC050980 TaxID=3155161 RepID=UPI0033CC655D